VAPPPEPDNWLLGKWQGPSLGCPPGGGVEFNADKSFTYYKGKISATLPVSYRVNPDSVTVTTVGSDGIEQNYVYQKTGLNSMIIVGIPPNMPRSLLGTAALETNVHAATAGTAGAGRRLSGHDTRFADRSAAARCNHQLRRDAGTLAGASRSDCSVAEERGARAQTGAGAGTNICTGGADACSRSRDRGRA
jgi:hypothetical protein